MSCPLRALVAVIFAAALAACSPSEPDRDTAQSTQVPSVNAKAREDLAMYDGLVKSESWTLAAPIGEGIVKRWPQSDAAGEVRKTLADVQAKAAKINETRRLEALWMYQTGEQDGGAQSTASIHPSQPASEAGRIQLILRRHADWGESAYLYDNSGRGFVCPGRCSVSIAIDGGESESMDADLPDTGDPALFLEEYDRLGKILAQAETLDITVGIAGAKDTTLRFEVAGFDPARWKPLP